VEFREYDVTNGKWIFSVKHFSIYGIDNDDFDNYVATQKKSLLVMVTYTMSRQKKPNVDF